MTPEEIIAKLEADLITWAQAPPPTRSEQLDQVREAYERVIGQPCIASWGTDGQTITVQTPVIAL